MPRSLILGMGNPILGDDSVGYRLGEILSARLTGSDTVVMPTSKAWLCLLDQMEGFDRLAVIDAVCTGLHPPGTLIELGPDEIDAPEACLSIHHYTAPQMLRIGRGLGLDMPGTLWTYGVEIAPPTDFSGELSESLNSRLENIAEQITSREQAEVPPGRPVFD